MQTDSDVTIIAQRNWLKFDLSPNLINLQHVIY